MAQREVTDDELRFARFLGTGALRSGADYLWVEKLADGRRLFLMPQVHQGVRIGVSEPGDDTGFAAVYDYAEALPGWRAVLGWDGEGDPEGWVRAWAQGEIPRRRPDGKPESEYRAP